jgi:tryptophanyl-tRNA synthetase
MSDDAETIAKKIQKAKTDPEPLPSDEKGLEGRPEAENLVGIYAALSGQSVAGVLKDYGGQQFSSFKKALAEVATEKIGDIGAEAARLMADPAEIDRILADGSARARAITVPVMAKVKDIVGFIRS